VPVQVDWGEGVPRCRTDAAGRYTGYVDASSVTPHVPEPPPPYYFRDFFLATRAIPAGTTEIDARPLVLGRGGTRRGRVVDEAGRPVPGAALSATWLLAARGFDTVSGWADRDGSFALPGVDARAEIQLSARWRGKTTARPVTVRAGGRPVTV